MAERAKRSRAATGEQAESKSLRQRSEQDETQGGITKDERSLGEVLLVEDEGLRGWLAMHVRAIAMYFCTMRLAGNQSATMRSRSRRFLGSLAPAVRLASLALCWRLILMACGVDACVLMPAGTIAGRFLRLGRSLGMTRRHPLKEQPSPAVRSSMRCTLARNSEPASAREEKLRASRCGCSALTLRAVSTHPAQRDAWTYGDRGHLSTSPRTCSRARQ